MITRLHFLTHTFQGWIEGGVLGAIAAYQGTAAALGIISDGDWSRIVGSHGALFLAVVAVALLWSRSLLKERNEDRRRTHEEAASEARSTALLAALTDANESNKALTVESIRAQGKATEAINRMNSTIQNQTVTLCERLERIERAEKQTTPHHDHA